MVGLAALADAIDIDAIVQVANLVVFTGETCAILVETFSVGAALTRVAGNTETIGRNALVLKTDFTKFRTIFNVAILGVTPAVGANHARLFTIDTDTGPPLADPIDTHFSFIETARATAIGRVTKPAGAQLVAFTVHSDTCSLDTFFFDTYFAVADTFLGITIDWIAVACCAALALTAVFSDTTGR